MKCIALEDHDNITIEIENKTNKINKCNSKIRELTSTNESKNSEIKSIYNFVLQTEQ